MVHVLPRVEKEPSFSSQLGLNLGSSVATGTNKFFSDLIKDKKQQKLLEQIEGPSFKKNSNDNKFANQINPKQLEEKFIQLIPELEKEAGRELMPEDLDHIWNNFQKMISPQEQSPQMMKESASPIEDAEFQRDKMAQDLLKKSKKYAAVGQKDLSNIALKEAEMGGKKFEAERKFHSKRSDKFLDEMKDLSHSLRERELAVDSAISAVQSGQMTKLGGDWWANALNLPNLRSASGAALNAASKVNLMGSLGKVGARPNQFIEKQISDAFAQAGESKEAQMTKLTMTKALIDLDKKYAEIASDLADEDRQKYGYVKGDIDGRTEKALKPFAEQKMKEAAFDIRQNIEKDMSPMQLDKNYLNSVSSGTPLTPEMAHYLMQKLQIDEAKTLKVAKKLGYEIPSDEFLRNRGYSFE